MRTIIAATDLSARSDLAVQRAGQLARKHGANLVLLHVVDDDQPADLMRMELEAATAYLTRGKTGDLESVVIRCEAGDAFNVICEVSQEEGADLIILGAHRRKLLRDIFTGTTAERVMRESQRPVLMVNAGVRGEYKNPAVCIDLGDSSMNAAVIAHQIGLLPSGANAIHAYPSLSRLQLSIVGVDREEERDAIAGEQAAIWKELSSFLAKREIAGLGLRPSVVEGALPTAVNGWASEQRVDLLVVGTHNRTGLPRLLLGSAATSLLASATCDVLVVPSGAAA